MTKILLVDDEPDYCDAMRKLLSREGFEVRLAADGLDAIDVVGNFTPDLLVVDWILQGSMDGLEVIKALRADNSEMKIILITGSNAAQLQLRIGTKGNVRCLQKPFEAQEIVAIACNMRQAAGMARDRSGASHRPCVPDGPSQA